MKDKLSSLKLNLENLIERLCYKIDDENYLQLTREELVYKF